MRVWLLVLVIAVIGAACGGGSDAAPAGSARSGQDLFEERILGPNPGCITCHSLNAGTTLVGPPIAGVALRAQTRVPGMSAADYLRASIVDPSAYVVPGFDDGRMPADWAEALTAPEIEAIVDYLLTLR